MAAPFEPLTISDVYSLGSLLYEVRTSNSRYNLIEQKFSFSQEIRHMRISRVTIKFFLQSIKGTKTGDAAFELDRDGKETVETI